MRQEQGRNLSNSGVGRVQLSLLVCSHLQPPAAVRIGPADETPGFHPPNQMQNIGIADVQLAGDLARAADPRRNDVSMEIYNKPVFKYRDEYMIIVASLELDASYC